MLPLVMSFNTASPETSVGLECWIDAAVQSEGWASSLHASACALGAKAIAVSMEDAQRAECGFWAYPERYRRSLERILADQRRQTPTKGIAAQRIASALARNGDGTYAARIVAYFPGKPAPVQAVARAAAQALALAARVRALEQNARLKTAAFDVLPFGVAIVDRSMSVAESNNVCRTLLARADGLVVVNGRLTCIDGADQRAVQKAVSDTLDARGEETVVGVRRKRGERPYVVRPLPQPLGAPSELCLLMIIDPDAPVEHDGDIWRTMFDLTASELAIAEGIVSGRRITDIAFQRGVSIETVRSQTKSMLARLDASSQAQAVARLSRLGLFGK